jgi:uncharacterized integral membrane protein
VRLPFWILVVLAALIAVFLVLPNRQPVDLRLWLFDYSVQLPLYLVLFATVFVGFVVGWIGCWFSQGRWRRQARERGRRVEYLEREAVKLTDQMAKLEADAAARPPGQELSLARSSSELKKPGAA